MLMRVRASSTLSGSLPSTHANQDWFSVGFPVAIACVAVAISISPSVDADCVYLQKEVDAVAVQFVGLSLLVECVFASLTETMVYHLPWGDYDVVPATNGSQHLTSLSV